ncbi:MAG: hypothetical protein IJF97_00730 [Eggerthellaceae bacterium]|nr:hypothetical protein [Eggerthellaceae bacterium]MBQ3342683.1 hypothetical protein [Kiritimatiellia bacterium]
MPYPNKIVKDGTTLIDLTSDTVTPATLMQGYTAHDASGAIITGTASGGSDALVVTLSWDSTEEMWTPDCTINELQDAYVGGKEIVFVGGNGELAGWFYDDDYAFGYSIQVDGGINTLLIKEYFYTTQGIEYCGDTRFIFPNFETPSRTYTPTTSQQTERVNFNSSDDFNGIEYVDVTVAAMPTGTAGTPTATKGTVSNHSVSVTPSVTNTTGYVTGGTKTGTAVTVSASELVSGSETKTENGTYDVTNLAELVVNVSGGGGGSSMSIGTETATLSSAASSISFTGLSGNPLSFVVTSSADASTGGTAAVAVAYDGTSLHGMDVTTQAEADTGYSKSYSGGTLTITATTAEFQANEYKLVYAYGGSSSDIHTSDVQVGSGATSITFSGLSGRPLYFSCVFKSSFSTSSGYQRVIEVVNDGTSTYGHSFDSSAHAATSWGYTYSGGALTVSSTSTNNGGYFHQPGYYQLTYAVDPNAVTYQAKTGVGASTSSQTIYPDTGYDALESVQINAVSQTNLTAANIKSGTTVTISNGNTNLWSVTGTYTGGGGGGSSSIATTTWTNSSNTATSHQFTGLSGTPIAAFLRCTTSLSRSSGSTNYFIADMVWDGSTCKGNSFRRSNGTYANVTSGYSVTTGSNSITFTSSGTSTTNPGSFYNGTYELVYVY